MFSKLCTCVASTLHHTEYNIIWHSGQSKGKFDWPVMANSDFLKHSIYISRQTPYPNQFRYKEIQSLSNSTCVDGDFTKLGSECRVFPCVSHLVL